MPGSGAGAAGRRLVGVLAASLTALAIVISTDPARAQAGACASAPASEPERTILTCGRVIIEFERGARYRLVDRDRDGEPEAVRLDGGAALLEYRPGPRRRFQILTPHAVASVRGTRWVVDVLPDASHILVVDGHVGVRRGQRQAAAVVVGPDEGVDVLPGTGPLEVKRWREARIRALLARFGRGSMRRAPATVQLTVLAGLLGLAWAVLLGRWHVEGQGGVLDRIEMLALDARLLALGPRPAPADVVFVAIDDATVRSVGQYPLPRPVLARLINRIAEQAPGAIAIDLLMVDSGGEADRILADALRAAPAVIGAAAVFDGEMAGDLPRAAEIIMPVEPLRSAATVGTVNIAADHGGTPRHVPLFVAGPSGPLPAFALAAASIAAGGRISVEGDAIRIAGRVVPLDLGHHLPIRFYGPRGAIRTVSAAAILSGEKLDEVKGRIVVVGATALGTGDTFTTPFAPVAFGAEILATAIGNLMAGDGLVRTRDIRWLDAVVAVLLALAAVLLLALGRTMLALAGVAALAVGWCAMTLAAFSADYWLSVSVPLAAVVSAAALSLAVRLWRDRRAAQLLAEATRGLERFHAPQISERLSHDPGFLASPVSQRAAVMFVDLSGFTGLTERIGASRARELLADFHGILDSTVSAAGGFVVAFMGDGAMILFGFPEATADTAVRAIETAQALDWKIDVFIRQRVFETDMAVRARIGAHYGPVVISRLGSISHQHITATGDPVNVASRLLEVAKDTQARIVITEELFQAAGLGDAQTPFSPSRPVSLRGRLKPVVVRSLERAAVTGSLPSG